MLIDRNILIRECSDFRGLDKNYFRIAVKRRKDNAILIEALKHAEDLLGRDKFHL
jgi:threonine-phosphate decarboxylase